MRVTDSVTRVVEVLDVLSGVPDGLGVSDIAGRLHVHRSTASRLLGSLAASGMVERDQATRRYRLGARIVGLAASAVPRLPVVSQARPALEQLSAMTSETANLAILDRTHVVYVDQVTPTQAVVMASWVGRRSPAHASSSGKVLLAFGTAQARDAILRRPLESLTPHTVTDPRRLREILAETRRVGYASSSGELEEGLVTMAAPVLKDGCAIAAVSLSGPRFRIPPGDLPRLLRSVVRAATEIEHRMAGRTTALLAGA